MSDSAVSLEELAEQSRLQELEDAWMERMEAGPTDLRPFLAAARRLVENEKGEESRTLLGLLVEQLAAGDPPEGTTDFVEGVLLLHPGDRGLAAALRSLAERAGDEHVARLLDAVSDRKGDARRRLVRGGLALRPGTFVRRSGHPDALRVMEMRAESGGAALVIDDGTGPEEIPLETAVGELQPVPPEDFYVRLRFDPEGLVEEAKKDPAALVRRVLASSGGRIEGEALKRLLARGVVAPQQYRRWWNKARPLLERDPMVTVYGDDDPVLILRDEPVRHEEELARRLEGAAGGLEAAAVAREYVGSLREGHEPDPQFVALLLESLAREAAQGDPCSAAAAAQAASDLAVATGSEPPAGLPDANALLPDSRLLDLPERLADEDWLADVLEWLEERGGKAWPPFAGELLGRLSARSAERLAQGLEERGEREQVAAAVRRILEAPHRHPEGILWLFRRTAAEKSEVAGVSVDPFAIVLQLLRLMERAARRRDAAAFLQRARQSITQGDHRILRRVVPGLAGDQARALFGLVRGNPALSETTRRKLETLLEEHHHEAIHGRKELWEEDVIYTSPRGLRNREEEFDRIVNDEMVKNSAAIGHAADFGDLSENAEFTAALEQRDFLSRRANEVGEEIRKARIIPIESIPTDRVNVGTVVRLADESTGEEIEITLLGPWDADPERGVYSYQAPAVRGLLGRSVGETAELNGPDRPRRVRVVAIERAALPE